jgi:hypothetical protein
MGIVIPAGITHWSVIPQVPFGAPFANSSAAIEADPAG